MIDVFTIPVLLPVAVLILRKLYFHLLTANIFGNID